MNENIEPAVFNDYGDLTEYGKRKFGAFISYIKQNYSFYSQYITDELYWDMFSEMEERGEINPLEMIQIYVISQSFDEPF